MSPVTRTAETVLRVVAHTYIRCGANLYYVLGKVGVDQVHLENCKTGETTLATRKHVCEECEPVCAARALPTLPLKDTIGEARKARETVESRL